MELYRKESKRTLILIKERKIIMSSKNQNPNKKPLILRIFVLALCALMVIGLVASALAGMAI